jgi:hypothetical protein
MNLDRFQIHCKWEMSDSDSPRLKERLPVQKTGILLVTLLVVPPIACSLAPAPVRAEEAHAATLRQEFLKLCDTACGRLRQKKRKEHFFIDAYAVRALAVAYDMTGRKGYLNTCQAWSDEMIAYQDKMIPKGAYYMNYHRKPGQTEGEWFVADASCIGMGVLATAARTTDPARKKRYLDSVQSFARLVMDNYIGPDRGITDGHWDAFAGEWYCSSGAFAAMAFLLYDQTGKEEHRDVAMGVIDWLNRLDFYKTKHLGYNEGAPAVVFYMHEGYGPALPHLKPGSEPQRMAVAQIRKALQWMEKCQAGRNSGNLPKAKWMNYQRHGWGAKFGGLPYLMCVFSHHLADGESLRAEADKELRHISSLLFEKDRTKGLQLQRRTRYQFRAFSMMSYAENLRPGALLRGSELPSQTSTP